jgi:hypothetical protein
MRLALPLYNPEFSTFLNVSELCLGGLSLVRILQCLKKTVGERHRAGGLRAIQTQLRRHIKAMGTRQPYRVAHGRTRG